MSKTKRKSLNPSKLDSDSKTKTIKNIPNHLVSLKNPMIQSKGTPEEISLLVESQ